MITTANDARKAHKILDDLLKGKPVLDEEREFLRRALPELPKQKTLEEIIEHVYDAWMRTNYNEWAGNIDNPDILIEEWLVELHTQLQGLKGAPAKPTHPEFLETEADYENVPEGTIVAKDGISTAWIKRFEAWKSTDGDRGVRCPSRKVGRRRVLRWGWGE